jgi:O-antigen ligase
MTDGLLETPFALACLTVLAAAAAVVLFQLSVVRPRLGLYTLFAFAPTQFIFVPVGSFFLSPADVVVLACAAGLVARLASGSPQARAAVRLHVMLGIMIAAYLIGFVILDHFSRTLVRLPLAFVPSILACELLERREHFTRAIAALIVAALLDAGYGLFFIALGQPLHPTRFSGMMGVNFSAMVILTGAAMAFAVLARTREPMKLGLPAVLALLAVATLSRAGLVAFLLAGGLVLWKIANATNRRLVVAAATACFAVVASHDGVRERVLARTRPQLQQDGVERTSGDVRVRILEVAWRALDEQPFVGVGFFNFQRYSTRDPEIQRSTLGLGYATHNTYLEVLAEGGVLAFVPFLLHFFSYGERSRRAFVVMLREQDVSVAAALSGFTVVMVTAWAVNLLFLYLFWSVCGLALACIVRPGGRIYPTDSHGALPLQPDIVGCEDSFRASPGLSSLRHVQLAHRSTTLGTGSMSVA